jgi:hypothetical protein
MGVSAVNSGLSQVSPGKRANAIDWPARVQHERSGVQHERCTKLTVNMSKADTQYVDDALTIEDEYESELAAVQVALTRFEVAPHEYAAKRAEIAARAYFKLADAHKRFIGRNN